MGCLRYATTSLGQVDQLLRMKLPAGDQIPKLERTLAETNASFFDLIQDDGFITVDFEIAVMCWGVLTSKHNVNTEIRKTN